VILAGSKKWHHRFFAPDVGLVLEEVVGTDQKTELKGILVTGDGALPDFHAATFSRPTQIDNMYLPWFSGEQFVYAADTANGFETHIVGVLDKSRDILGVTCIVVRDRVFLRQVLTNDSHNWYAQDNDGNVWHMGESIDQYNYGDNGAPVDITHEGFWEAGLHVAGTGTIAEPGHVMKSELTAGES
jgi:hypothetical protein